MTFEKIALSSKSTKKSGLKHSLVFQSFITIRKKVHVASTQYKWCSIGGLWGYIYCQNRCASVYDMLTNFRWVSGLTLQSFSLNY